METKEQSLSLDALVDLLADAVVERLHGEDPYFASIRQAAEAAGLSDRRMRELANSADPPAFIRNGKDKRIYMPWLAPYLESHLEGWRPQ